MLISRGSLAELVDDLNTCDDEGYLPSVLMLSLNAEAVNLLRQLNGYVRYLRESKVGENSRLREEPVRYSIPEENGLPEEFPD